MHAAVAEDPNVLFVDSSCEFHLSQLIVKTGMKLVDSWSVATDQKWTSYYSVVTKMVHVWRDMPRAFFQEYKKKYGEAAALQHAKKIPSKCVAGRWASIGNTHQDITDSGRMTTWRLSSLIRSGRVRPPTGPRGQGATPPARARS